LEGYMESETIFETVNLRKEFGALVAVDNVSMKVRRNTLHAIIGPNGAGKTTFFNLLSGNIEPTAGKVIYKGKDITRLPLHRSAHIGIGRSFQITNLFPNLTALENVRLACQALGKDNFQASAARQPLQAVRRAGLGHFAAGGFGRARLDAGPHPAPWRPTQAGAGHHPGL
jgi:ABC-type branched-subunit amino acid transport system ATPase component